MGQFALDVGKYADNNHFIRINHVFTEDSRWNPISSKRKFKFYDIDARQMTSYISNQFVINGKFENKVKGTVEDKKMRLIFGQYFFYSQTLLEHRREAFNIL